MRAMSTPTAAVLGAASAGDDEEAAFVDCCKDATSAVFSVSFDGLKKKRPRSAELIHGVCWPLVSLTTCTRTSVIRVEISMPGRLMLSRSAVVNGLLRPLPSSATFPGLVEKAIRIPDEASFSSARPRLAPCERDATLRLRDSGLSRQASRNSNMVLASRSICAWMNFSGMVSKSRSLSYSSRVSTGAR